MISLHGDKKNTYYYYHISGNTDEVLDELSISIIQALKSMTDKPAEYAELKQALLKNIREL